MVLRSPPDLIISDVNMPHLDGFEFIEALKADKSLPEIPVIFLTSVEEGDHRGKSLGAVGYITKPVRADKLLTLVAQHVSGGRTASRSRGGGVLPRPPPGSRSSRLGAGRPRSPSVRAAA